LGKFGKFLAGGLFTWLIVLWILTSGGYGVNEMKDYKGKVLMYKKSIREGSKRHGSHYYGRTGGFRTGK
jgi:hypothetical protein